MQSDGGASGGGGAAAKKPKSSIRSGKLSLRRIRREKRKSDGSSSGVGGSSERAGARAGAGSGSRGSSHHHRHSKRPRKAPPIPSFTPIDDDDNDDDNDNDNEDDEVAGQKKIDKTPKISNVESRKNKKNASSAATDAGIGTGSGIGQKSISSSSVRKKSLVHDSKEDTKMKSRDSGTPSTGTDVDMNILVGKPDKPERISNNSAKKSGDDGESGSFTRNTGIDTNFCTPKQRRNQNIAKSHSQLKLNSSDAVNLDKRLARVQVQTPSSAEISLVGPFDNVNAKISNKEIKDRCNKEISIDQKTVTAPSPLDMRDIGQRVGNSDQTKSKLSSGTEEASRSKEAHGSSFTKKNGVEVLPSMSAVKENKSNGKNNCTKDGITTMISCTRIDDAENGKKNSSQSKKESPMDLNGKSTICVKANKRQEKPAPSKPKSNIVKEGYLTKKTNDFTSTKVNNMKNAEVISLVVDEKKDNDYATDEVSISKSSPVQKASALLSTKVNTVEELAPVAKDKKGSRQATYKVIRTKRPPTKKGNGLSFTKINNAEVLSSVGNVQIDSHRKGAVTDTGKGKEMAKSVSAMDNPTTNTNINGKKSNEDVTIEKGKKKSLMDKLKAKRKSRSDQQKNQKAAVAAKSSSSTIRIDITSPGMKDFNVSHSKSFADKEKELNREHDTLLKQAGIAATQGKRKPRKSTKTQEKTKNTKAKTCALCSTCSCNRALNSLEGRTIDENMHPLQKFARTDAEVERALIGRLARLEKSASWFDGVAMKVKRELKRHQQKIKAKVVRKDDPNRPKFLCDTSEVEFEDGRNFSAQALPKPVVRKARMKAFSFRKKHQPTLTQMLGDSDSDEVQILGESDTEENNDDSSKVETIVKHYAVDAEKSENLWSASAMTKDQLEEVSRLREEAHPICTDYRELDPELSPPSSSIGEKDDYADDGFAELLNVFEATDNGDSLASFDDLLLAAAVPETEKEECTIEHEHTDIDITTLSQLSPKAKNVLNSLEEEIEIDRDKIDLLEEFFPNWKENIRFSLCQKPEEVKKALCNVQKKQEQIRRATEMLQKRQVIMEVYEKALRQSLDRFGDVAVNLNDENVTNSEN